MVYKNFNIAIFLRISVLIALTAAGTWFYFHSRWLLLGLCIVFILITTYYIIDYFNSINRRLAFFFDSIRNEDSTLHFPENVKSRSIKKLNQSLNNVNRIISDIKIRNENKERFFLEFMKHSTTGLMAVDERGYIEIINDAALKLFDTGVLVHIKRLEQINEDFYNTITTLQTNQSKTIKVLVKEELHIVLIRKVDLKFDEKVYSLYSLSDIKTELDEKEMDTWQKLIRILTHEIMNSVAPISSISSTLSNYFSNGKDISSKELENIQHGLDVIHERSIGMIHFVDNYRKLSKIPKPAFKMIHVDEWLDSIHYLFKDRAMEDNIKLEIQNNFAGKSFLGDQKLLTQVAINLLNNAADALKHVDDKKLQIHISGMHEDNISIRFIDNGPGVSPENFDQIFMPFYTTKENGSGIGLSLSRQIMKLHRGQLTARSTPGKETVFEMRI